MAEDDVPELSDKLEKVSEVTSSHVKLSEPVFSPRMGLVKVGSSVKINCDVLIYYKPNTSFLKLHIYLIPHNLSLQKELDQREVPDGYKLLLRSHPEKSLKMRDRFILTADLDNAEICPETLMLRYESRTPNFFEVFIEEPDKPLTLKLTQENEHQAVWTCVILKDEYQTTAHTQEGPSGSLEPQVCESITQGSSDWTILEPEMSSTDGDETTTYSLQSEAGKFECSVSGMRWVCKEKVSFKFQFCSWKTEMESIHYMPVGPLMDITVIAGKLDEAHLPHCISIDKNPETLDKFAVLHIDDCGDEVEKASEVTSSHVKLSEPVFSPRGVLMKAGFPVKVNCNVLIYKTNAAFLTLHIYLIPRDPALQQAIDRRELSYGNKDIKKPHPMKFLKLNNCFILTADLGGACVNPETLRLRYETKGEPNFFEVFIQNPDRNTKLTLTQQNEHEPVWSCVIRQDELQSTFYAPEEHLTEPIQTKENMSSVKKKLLETLQGLNYGELEQFKHVLQQTEMEKGLPRERCRMETADRDGMVFLMVETYGQQSVELTGEVLKKMKRDVEQTSGKSSGSEDELQSTGQTPEEPSGNSKVEESILQVSSGWTKREPEASSKDGDEVKTYSLQSEAGNFECSVSGMRWVCKEKVSFKYQICSSEVHMKITHEKQYMPAGPLIDLTVIAGKLDEVYLPHWICIDIPKILDNMAVLRIDDRRVVVEKVSKVTGSHVKLSGPVSCQRVGLVKCGSSVEWECDVLIYKTTTQSLTLHVYLIPDDSALKTEVRQTELSEGYQVIRKPSLEKTLKMHDRFILTADLDSAEICPEDIKLKSRKPNYFEVFIANPVTNFKLKLTQEKERRPVWSRTIRKDDYQCTGHMQAAGSPSRSCEGATGRVKETKGQPPKTIKQTLKKMLEDLSRENFERFCSELWDREDGPSRVQLEGKKRFEIADLLVSVYTMNRAPRVAAEILREIRCINEAELLEKHCG